MCLYYSTAMLSLSGWENTWETQLWQSDEVQILRDADVLGGR